MDRVPKRGIPRLGALDSVPPAVGRKGHVCVVVAPRRGVQTLLRRDASHPRPFRPIVRPLVFGQSLGLRGGAVVGAAAGGGIRLKSMYIDKARPK